MGKRRGGTILRPRPFVQFRRRCPTDRARPGTANRYGASHYLCFQPACGSIAWKSWQPPLQASPERPCLCNFKPVGLGFESRRICYESIASIGYVGQPRYRRVLGLKGFFGWWLTRGSRSTIVVDPSESLRHDGFSQLSRLSPIAGIDPPWPVA